MKKTIIILLTTFFITSCKAQNTNPQEVKSAELNQFIGTMISYQKKELKENAVSCIIVTNASGSAGNEGTGEVSNKLYISNCQYGETTDCKLYASDELIKIIVDSITENDSEILIQITSGNFKQRKKSTLKIRK